MAHAVPSLFLGSRSCFAVNADSDVAASDVAQTGATSRDLAGKSSMGDAAAAVGDVAHMVMDQLEEAWEEDIAGAVARSTSVDFAAIAEVVVRTFCVDHVLRAMPQRLESSTAEYDMRSEGMEVATFVRLP